ncbi:MAG: hypothetical protein HUJ71_03585, partial [Pseudobutyrivibrio sp.]|nr:hypothetical protein [Pseudobutyrivibrio sp.]
MKKEEMEGKVDYQAQDFEVDLTEDAVPTVVSQAEQAPNREAYRTEKQAQRPQVETVSCLRNQKVVVRYIPKTSGIWGNNPKHVLSGGMADTAVRSFVVPRLSSGLLVNVLTDSEKAFLEEYMGLEYNALSIYKKVNNFWSDSNETGINRVRLTKHDNYLDLSDPEDYIKYKILLANKDFIAPSLQALQDAPKATYQFVIIEEGQETKMAQSNMSATMACYKEYGKIENDTDTLRVIIETIDKRPTAANTKLDGISEYEKLSKQFY